MSNNFFDESVREKMEGHEAPVPAGAWANIQGGKRKRRPVPFFWLFAALVVGGLTTMYFYYNGSTIKNNLSAQNEPVKNSKIISPISSPGNNAKNNESIVKQYEETIAGNSTAKENVPTISNNTDPVFDNARNEEEINNTTVTNSDATDRNKKSIYKRSGNKTKVRIRSAEASDNDGLTVSKKNKRSTNAKTMMSVQAPDLAESAENTIDSAIRQQVMKEERDHISSKEKAPEVDTITKMIATAHHNMVDSQPMKKTAQKKKVNKRFYIDLSFSGIIPTGNRAMIANISRTTVEPLHTAAFSADKVRLRLQPSAGFNLSLFKPLNSKFTIGTGLNYQVVKEYIHLSGEEVNTNYAIVKRLSGNVLIDDTVSTITKGTRTIDAVNSYTFLSIPVTARYRLLQHQYWTMELQAAIDVNLRATYKNSIGGNLVSSFTNPNYSKRNTSVGTGFNVGLRLNRRLHKNYSMYLSPYFQFNTRRLYLKDMLAPATMHRAGFAIGWSYHF